jgi:hypothetical protein
MTAIAGWMDRVANAVAAGDESDVEQVAKETRELTANFPVPA